MSDAQKYITKRFNQEKAKKANDSSYLIIDMTIEPPAFLCKNCGEREDLNMEMPHEMFVVFQQHFAMKHAMCEPSEETRIAP